MIIIQFCISYRNLFKNNTLYLLPKYFSAVFFEITTELIFFSAVAGLP